MDSIIEPKTPDKEAGVEIWYCRIACTQHRIPNPLSLKMISGVLETASAVIFPALAEDQSREQGTVTFTAGDQPQLRSANA